MPPEPPFADRLPVWLRVGFSGHRHLANPAEVGRALGRTIDRLEERTRHIVGVSSAASGADTLFAEEMLRRAHPLRILLPFPAARFKEDFAGEPVAWQRSVAVIDAAIDVDVAGSTQPGATTPEDAYLETGIRTVDDSDLLIAAWDQQPVKGRGGTGDVVAYARSIGRPIILIDPETGVVSDHDLERILPAKQTTTFDFNRSPRETVESYYATVNRQAERQAPVVRELMRWCVLLQLLASSLTTAGLIFGAEGPAALAVTAVDTGVLGLSFVMLWMRGRRHREWRRLRAEAEVCRSALATWDIGRASRPAPRAPLLGLGGLLQSIDLLRQIDRSPVPSFEDVRERYESDRILEQLAYFRSKHAVAHRQVKRRKILMTLLTGIGIVAVLTSAGFLIGGIDSQTFAHWLDFVGIVAPLGASALGVLLITDESARRHEKYQQMAVVLEGWRPRLAACRTWDSLGRLATMVEDELLQEVLEWRAFATYTEHVE